MGCRQFLPLSVFQLKSKHCWKPHCRNGVVDTFGQKIIKNNNYYWNALSQSHRATILLNYSQSIKINIGPSDGRTIVPTTHHPTVLYWRLLDFKTRVDRNIPEFNNFSGSIFLRLGFRRTQIFYYSRVYAANFGYEISIRCDTHFCESILNTEIESKE